MAKRIILWVLGALFIILAATALLYRPLIQPWHLRFGATDGEVQAARPGDTIIAGETSQSTRAITIHAPAAQAWPWLLDGDEPLTARNIDPFDSIVPLDPVQ